MLLKALQNTYRNFARSLKPPMPPPNLKEKKQSKKSMSSLKNTDQNDKQEQYDFEEKVDFKQNKELKQKDRKLMKEVKRMVDQGLASEEIINSFISQKQLSEFSLFSPEEKQKIDEVTRFRQKQAYQQLILDEITKGKKNQELPIGSRYDDKLQKEEEKFIKQQKIIKAIREKQNLSSIEDQLSIVTMEDKLTLKYPKHVVTRASEQKEKDLRYFKQLTEKSDDFFEFPFKESIGKRRIRKDETYEQVVARDKQQKIEKKEKTKEMKEIENFIKEQKQLEYEEYHHNNTTSPVVYEDQNYYREKGMRQFQAIQSNKIELSEESKQIMDAGEKDLQEGLNQGYLLYEEYQDNYRERSYKKELYDASSFGKEERKVQALYKRLNELGYGLELQELKKMNKELLFQQKKLREEQQQYQKYLIKKEKQKKADEIIKSIHSEKLRQDLDFQIDFKNRFSDVNYDPLDLEGNLEKVKAMNRQREALVLKRDKTSEIHYKKTQFNMSNFIKAYFFSNLCNPNSQVNQIIKISDIRFNEKKTLIHVFWKFDYEINSGTEAPLQEVRKVQKKLEKSATYISGKMTQQLQLRYGPDIRFHHEYISSQTQEIVDQLTKHRKQIIEAELKSYRDKGYIQNKQQEREFRKNLEAIAKQNLKGYHNRKQMLSKKSLAKQKEQMKGKQKKQRAVDKKVKKDTVENFWENELKD